MSRDKDTQGTGIGSSKYVQLVVKLESYVDVRFLVKWTTPMGKLLNLYCKKADLNPPPTFQYDGHHIDENDTPQTLEMENGGIIEVFRFQTGGN